MKHMSDSGPGGRATVMVVDDDADIRSLIVGQLQQENYRLLSAANLGELRRALQDEPIDLIVLDLNLPDGDGLSLCRELRAEGSPVQIIMVSVMVVIPRTSRTRKSMALRSSSGN